MSGFRPAGTFTGSQIYGTTRSPWVDADSLYSANTTAGDQLQQQQQQQRGNSRTNNSGNDAGNERTSRYPPTQSTGPDPDTPTSSSLLTGPVAGSSKVSSHPYNAAYAEARSLLSSSNSEKMSPERFGRPLTEDTQKPEQQQQQQQQQQQFFLRNAAPPHHHHQRPRSIFSFSNIPTSAQSTRRSLSHRFRNRTIPQTILLLFTLLPVSPLISVIYLLVGHAILRASHSSHHDADYVQASFASTAALAAAGGAVLAIPYTLLLYLLVIPEKSPDGPGAGEDFFDDDASARILGVRKWYLGPIAMLVFTVFWGTFAGPLGVACITSGTLSSGHATVAGTVGGVVIGLGTVFCLVVSLLYMALPPVEFDEEPDFGDSRGESIPGPDQ
jgi:hypothetical protein